MFNVIPNQAKRMPPERMPPLLRVLDQGLEIFAAAQRERIPPEVASRLDRLEGRAERLKRVNHELLQVNETSLSRSFLVLPLTCRGHTRQLIHRRADHIMDALKEAFPPTAHPSLARALRRVATEEPLASEDEDEDKDVDGDGPAGGGVGLVGSGSYGDFAVIDLEEASEARARRGTPVALASAGGVAAGTGALERLGKAADAALARSSSRRTSTSPLLPPPPPQARVRGPASPPSDQGAADSGHKSNDSARRGSGRGSARGGAINERDPALVKIQSFLQARLHEMKEGGRDRAGSGEAAAEAARRGGKRHHAGATAAVLGRGNDNDGAGAGATSRQLAATGDGGDETLRERWGLLGPVYTAALKGDDGSDRRHRAKVATGIGAGPPLPTSNGVPVDVDANVDTKKDVEEGNDGDEGTEGRGRGGTASRHPHRLRLRQSSEVKCSKLKIGKGRAFPNLEL